MTSSDGTVYQGEFKNGKMHGQGVSIDKEDGAMYEGAFTNGK